MDRGDGRLLIVHPSLIPLYSHPSQRVPKWSNFVKKNKRLLAVYRSGKIILLLLCFSKLGFIISGYFSSYFTIYGAKNIICYTEDFKVTVSEYFVIVVFGRDSDFNS